MKKNIPTSLSTRLLFLRFFPRLHSKNIEQVEHNINSIYNSAVSVIHDMCAQFVASNLDLIKNYKLEVIHQAQSETPPTQVETNESMSITKRKRINAENANKIASHNAKCVAKRDNVIFLETEEEELFHDVNAVFFEIKSGVDVFLSKVKIDMSSINNPFDDFVFERSFIYNIYVEEVTEYVQKVCQ